MPRARYLANGTKRIFIVGESPGETEDTEGEPFVGPSGKILWDALHKMGLADHEIYIQNAVRCLPTMANGSSGKTGIKMIRACAPFLLADIENEQPDAILLLGAKAMQAVLKKSGMTTNRGTVFQYKVGDREVPLVVGYHPANVLYDRNMKPAFEQDIRFFRDVVLGKQKKTILDKMKLVLNPSAAFIQMFYNKAVTKGKPVAVDFETNTLQPLSREGFIALCVSFSDGVNTFVTELDEAGLGENSVRRDPPDPEAFKWIRALLEDKEVGLLGHSIKYDQHVAEARYGITMRNIVGDTLLLHRQLKPIQGSHNLGSVATEVLGVGNYKRETEEFGDGESDSNKFADMPFSLLAERNGADTFCTWHIHDRLLRKLDRETHDDEPVWNFSGLGKMISARDVYLKVSMPLSLVFQRMESYGIRVDEPYRKGLADKLEQEAFQALDSVRAIGPVKSWHLMKWHEVRDDLLLRAKDNNRIKVSPDRMIREKTKLMFNPNSRDQIADMLFGMAGFRIPIPHDWPRTPTGKIQITMDLMRELAHREFPAIGDFCEQCIGYQHAINMRSTFVVGLDPFIDKRGILHGSFNVSLAETGRNSSSNPNLQNIPTDEEGGSRFRKQLIPRLDHSFVDGDYSQIELRVMAAYSGDKNLIGVFNMGGDFHEETARFVFKLGKSAPVTKDQRRIAKTVNFGIAYGESAKSLAENIDVSIEEAQSFIDVYFERFPDLANWIAHTQAFAQDCGYVYTMFGKKRLLGNAMIKNARGEDWKRLGHAMRQATNTPVQGSASDVTSVALIRLDQEYEATRRISKGVIVPRLISTVHDSIITECRTVDVPLVEKIKRRVMETAYLPFIGPMLEGVPIVVDIEVTERSWGELRKYKEEEYVSQ